MINSFNKGGISLSKIEFDNFPKFLVSLGIVLFAFPFLVIHFFLQENAVLLVTERELSQLTAISSQTIIAKQRLCLYLTSNIAFLAIVCVLLGLILLVFGCKMWYSHQIKDDDKLDVEINTAKAQLRKLTLQEVGEKVANEVLELEHSDIIEENQEKDKDLSIDEIQLRQDAIRKENSLIYNQITKRYLLVEEAVINRIKFNLSSSFMVQDNVRINNINYDAIAVSKGTEYDYIIEVKYLISRSSWNADYLWSIINHTTQKLVDYTESTGRKSKALVIIVTQENQAKQASVLSWQKINEQNPLINVQIIAESDIDMLKISNI